MGSMKLIVYKSEEVEEGSALYVDGKLDRVWDHYLIDERIQELTGVISREGNFLLGGNSYSDAAQTVEEIDTYESKRDQEKNEAAQLEAQAAELIAQAKRLRGE